MTSRRISVVGIACRYPDADSKEQLWENVLAGRRAFRRIPDERLNLDDYYSPDPTAPDKFYTRKAAVLEGYEFDRVAHHIAGSTYRSTDTTHWLALETVGKALADAGFADGEGLPRESTGVIIGNTLTGEFSRANLMRLRWPYVARTIGPRLKAAGWTDEDIADFLDDLEQHYKEPFPEINEDTLAGGLANTIAGRVCNFFDFNGGGFTVDGACSSSLLSVANAADALVDGRLDVAIAGGVDLSIDPFEVIGFAKTSALAAQEMRVYDQRSQGFWPGEGCGVLVLMREEDALAKGLRSYATLTGWGYSSDGRGGITRPESAGHRLALKRAYENAGYGIDTVSYFEGHGTGTAVGDATELKTFHDARRAARPEAAPAAISSVKGNIGHTKAAAGVAGLIKAILAVHHEVIPPASSHYEPHDILTADDATLYVPLQPQDWPKDVPVRSGVSSMGFGGINAHVALEQADRAEHAGVNDRVLDLANSRQDAELILLEASDLDDMKDRLTQLAELIGALSYAEMGDVAAEAQRNLQGLPTRAAIVVSEPEAAQRSIRALIDLINAGTAKHYDERRGLYLDTPTAEPRIGFLFPGQGAPTGNNGGAMRRRFRQIEALFAHTERNGSDIVATENAQPRIAAATVAAQRILAHFNVHGTSSTGHSLGELSALRWAGVMDDETLLELAATRGAIMAEASQGGGSMAGIAADARTVEQLLENTDAVVAGLNGPRQTVVSGPQLVVDQVVARARAAGMHATPIRVSHAFHSPMVADAARAFAKHLAHINLDKPERQVVSTVTGSSLAAEEDIQSLLARQIVEPVRFAEAAAALAKDSDLLIEVGPGRILTGLLHDVDETAPVVAMDCDSTSLRGVLNTFAAAYVVGADLRHHLLFQDRFTRPFSLDKQLRFLQSPVEAAPRSNHKITQLRSEDLAQTVKPVQGPAEDAEVEDTLTVLRELTAERVELPIDAVDESMNPIDQLHLSSITVGSIVALACKRLGVPAPTVTSAFATSTLKELAALIDDLRTGDNGEGHAQKPRIDGVAPWVHAFEVELVETQAPSVGTGGEKGSWRLFAPQENAVASDVISRLEASGVGPGVLLWLEDAEVEPHLNLMLEAAKAAADEPGRFVTVGGPKGAAGLAKTLHLESPDVRTTLVTITNPDLVRRAPGEIAARLVQDVRATTDFSEIIYDDEGIRRVPVLRPHRIETPQTESSPVLGAEDVILVTGGGKGITAECAMSLAERSGASLALLGRSTPEQDAELAKNLARLTSAGIRFVYRPTDITSAADVMVAVADVEGVVGPVTAVLHGAGVNVPQAIGGLDEEEFRRTIAPKVAGLENVLAALPAERLRLLVTFASIIGRAGLRGEAHYATANDWLRERTEQIGRTNPNTRCLALEWSVWAGAGMGERLGVLEALIGEGIEPISTDDGVAILNQLVEDPSAPTALVVMGRADSLPTITLETTDLPLARFLERTRVHYPGIELVTEADLSVASDPYLLEHDLDGDLLFPAVIGLEAMAEVARGLVDDGRAINFEEVEFLRPIVVDKESGATIRIAALVVADGSVKVAIRSSGSDYLTDHFRATVRFGGPVPYTATGLTRRELKRLPIDPGADLYGNLFFQGKRFQRLLGYRDLGARRCVADLSTVDEAPWFGQFQPQDLVLSSPGTRDAMMHTIQACVPDATLLPAGVERIWTKGHLDSPMTSSVVLHARERSQNGNAFIYDLDVTTAAGELIERWTGLELRAVRQGAEVNQWPPLVVGPLLERHARTQFGVPVTAAVVPNVSIDGGTFGDEARKTQTLRTLSVALEGEVQVNYRPDGRPETPSGPRLSASHGSGSTLAVTSPHPIACDLEQVSSRDDVEWQLLLGEQSMALAQLIAREQGEEIHVSATRVWAVIECARKLGQARPTITATAPGDRNGWITLRADGVDALTFTASLTGQSHDTVFAVVAERGGDMS